MDTSKIIIGTAGGGRYTVTAPIIKEDYGLYLKIEGLELPSTYEVDFSNSEHNGTSVTMIGNADGVLIPSQFISSGKDVFAFLYHVGVDFGRTVYKFRIPNKLRPDRTDEQPTPEEQSVIDQAIATLNDAVDRVEDAQEAIEGMTVSATTLAEGSSATVTKSEQEGVVHLEFGIPKGATGAQGERGEKGDKGDTGAQGIQGIQGERGLQGAKGDKGDTGATGAKGEQGERGLTGQDGISPTVSVSSITGGHEVSITDAQGTQTFDVMDGTDASATDVQINGTSIVSDGVANVPVASSSALGVIKVNGRGLGIYGNGDAYVSKSNFSQIKNGVQEYSPIVPANQHQSAFYGLAKSAGDTTQSQSSNAVGTYTDEAKVAIQKMLGIYEAPWELIREDTFTNVEEADHIISTDANGEPFELTDIAIFFYFPQQDTDAKKGRYGQIAYFKNGERILVTEQGAWEQAASTPSRGIVSLIEYNKGMVTVRVSLQNRIGYAQSEQIRIAKINSNDVLASVKFINDFSIDSINIYSVTGTGSYQLYGRRKWQ